MDSSASTTSSFSLLKPFLIVLFLLFLLTFIIRKGEDILLINGNHSWLQDQFFRSITNLGDGTILIPLVVIALFIRFRYVITIAAATAVLGTLVSLLKRVLFPDAERPKQFLNNELIYFVPDVKVHVAHSFPSGHAATAFCIAMLIALISKNKALGFFSLVLATLVGYSRIYLAQHFLMDVAAGAVLGCFTTYLAWEIVEKSSLPSWANRKLALTPFPLWKKKKTNSSKTISQA